GRKAPGLGRKAQLQLSVFVLLPAQRAGISVKS
ncbi:hypothetical protein A2U01_0092091, partial [Trifolium medium]|nr:hypothetical protein [Trifolium medium]